MIALEALVLTECNSYYVKWNGL